MRRALALSLVAAVLSSPLGAQVATFSDYSRPTTTEFQATPGAAVTSGGLDFYEFYSSNARNVLATWGTDAQVDPYGAANQPSNIGSSTAMFSTAATEIDMYGHGSDPNNPDVMFDLYSIDVAHLYAAPTSVPFMQNFSLTFFGFGVTGATISQTFAVLAPAPVGGVQTPFLQTLTFDARWHDMLNVWWNQPNTLSQQHQFTNVRSNAITATPEPGTYLLMLTGLAAMAVFTFRRRRA